MKVVEASWERRNLGMNAWEVVIERQDFDDIEKVKQALHDEKFKGSYVCLKLPVGNLKALHALEDDGFRFLETQFMIRDYFVPEKLLKFVGAIAPDVAVVELPKLKEEWMRIAAKIELGMFTTDRIALDPFFGEEVACKRYRNWMMDLFEEPNSFLEVTKVGDKEVAFALKIRGAGKRNKGILGGVFKEYLNEGFGIISMLDERALRNGEKKKTVVSSNNLDVVKLHQQCGRIIYDEVYVLRRFF